MSGWPALSHWFGIHPWDIGRLTEEELNTYIEAIPKEK